MAFISHFIRKYARPACYGFVAALLVACGGGGGDNIDSNPEPEGTVAISIANDEQVMNEAINTMGSAGSGVNLLSVGDTSTMSRIQYFDIVIDALKSKNSPVGLVAPLGVDPCDNPGGTFSYPGDGLSFATGNYTFTDCVLSGVTLNGTVLVSGTGDANKFDGFFAFNDLSATGSGVSVTIDGPLVIGWNWNANTSRTTGYLRNDPSTPLTVTVNGTTRQMTGLNLVFDEDESENGFDTFQYTVDSSNLGGNVVVRSTSPADNRRVHYYGTDEYYYQGEITIYGANGTKIILTAQGGGAPTDSVLMETIDATGTVVDSKIIQWLQVDAVN